MSENPIIDQTIHDLSRHCSSWKCHVFMKMKAYDSKLDSFLEPKSTDIFSLTESNMRSPNIRWYFCDFKYPLQPIHDVIASIQSHCLDAGTPLIVRNYYKDSCILQCKFHKIHCGKSLPQDSLYENGVRKTCFIHHQKRCSRGKSGQKSNRKSSINRMLDTSTCCGVRITISLCRSKNAFFIKPGFGNNEHRNHAPSVSGNDCIYHSSSVKESSQNHGYLNNLMTNGVSGTSAARMMMGSQPNRNVHVSRCQALYFGNQFRDDNKGIVDSPSNLIDYLESLENVSMSVLFHEIEESDSISTVDNKFTISNYQTESSLTTTNTHNYLENQNGEEHMDLMNTRSSRNIEPSSKIMVALAWVMDTDRKFFELYPEILMIDVTENTNNEKRPMLLVVGKDADGTTFVVMRVYLPHQRRWIFKWIFESCFKQLLGTSCCSKTNLVVTDGDRNIIDSLKSLMKKNGLFPNASYKRCMFHLVTLPMKEIPIFRQTTHQKQLWLIIVHWCLSFYRDIESETEYVFSKNLFLYFIKNNLEVRSHFDSNERELLYTWLQSKFFVHESDFASHLYRNKVTFYCNTTSPVEAHNKETKAKDSGVRPSYSTLMATKVLVKKDTYKASEKRQFSCVNLNQRPSWSSTVTAPHITNFAEGILHDQWGEKDMYDIVQIDDDTFWLLRNDDSNSDGLVPLFRRVRIVTITNNRIQCSCNMYEQTRIACRHIMAVTKEITLDYVGARYLKLFKYVNLRKECEKELFHDIMQRYVSIYDDNKFGIRISTKNILYKKEDNTIFPKILKGEVSYNDMYDIMHWNNSNKVKNFKNHVLPNGDDDFHGFLSEMYDVPNGLSQSVQISSQSNENDNGNCAYKETNVYSEKQSFYFRTKPIFDEILKLVETKPTISNDIENRLQQILNFAKEQNTDCAVHEMSRNEDNQKKVVSYNDKLDNRHKAKRHKYFWEK